MPPTVMTPPLLAAGCAPCVVLVGLVEAPPLPPELGFPPELAGLPELALPPVLAFPLGAVLPPDGAPLFETCGADVPPLLTGAGVPAVAPLLGVAAPELLPGGDE